MSEKSIKTYKTFTIKEKIAVLKWHKENGGVLGQTSKRFGVNKKRIPEWMEIEDKLKKNAFGDKKNLRKSVGKAKPLLEDLSEKSKKRNKTFTINEKLAVLKWHRENGCVLGQTSKRFGVNKKRIPEWMEIEDMLKMNAYGDKKNMRVSRGGAKPLFYDLDKELYQFYKSEIENGRSINNKVLSEESIRIALKQGLSNFKGSKHYINNFKKRFSLISRMETIEQKTPSYLEDVNNVTKIEMEKDSKKKNRKDAINITKIYETIKDKGFIQDLWLDVMSDLKEKPSYARLKNMVEKVIESAVDNYATKPKDHEERLKTRTIFTDLSIMTFTIDTLISELLHKKLKDEFKTIITNIVEEIKNKDLLLKKVSEVTDNMLENVEEFLCNGTEEKVESKLSKSSKTTSSTTKLPNKRPPATEDLHVDNLRKDLRSKTGEHSIDIFNSNTVALSIVETEPEENTNTVMNRPNLRNSIFLKNRKRKLPITLQKRRKTASNNSNNSDMSSEENTDVDIMNVSDDDALSFDGNCSISSVSSVHTSDLSSFEDDVSISSEDEEGRKTKKFVPLEKAKEYFNKYPVDKLKKMGKKKIKLQRASKSLESSKFTKDSPSKRLSGRTRKPNSKYASGDVICTLRQLIPQADASNSEKSEEEILKELFPNSESEKSLDSDKKIERRGRPRKSIPYHIEKFDQASESSSDSSLEEDIVPKKDDINITKEDVSLQSRRRGRPSKNMFKDNIVSTNNHQEFIPTDEEKRKFNITVHRPSVSGTGNGPIVFYKHKRGRPSKADLALRNEELKRTILMKSDTAFNKQSSQNVQQKSISAKSEPDSVHKKETLGVDTNTKKIDNVPFKHSVESFSILEESLCLKDKQIAQQNSPSKSSTKSYKTSDLYKPRSDFRVSFNSRGSKALTLFSN